MTAEIVDGGGERWPVGARYHFVCDALNDLYKGFRHGPYRVECDADAFAAILSSLPLGRFEPGPVGSVLTIYAPHGRVPVRVVQR